MKRLILLFVVLSSGCASPTLISNPGRNVMMVAPLTVTEIQNYDELGPVMCQENYDYIDMEESCRNTLRNRAAAMGGDIIVIESHMRIDCMSGAHDCIQMTARAYRRKAQPAPAPSAAPVSVPQ